jgi:hypothetical protein|tara:strand:+ start:2491 stop:3174 length:684 start_codon:yes stop_codon:yes gene_type:complete
MDFISIVLLSGSALIGPPDQDMWTFAATSSGENFSWTSPNPITATGTDYEMLYTITEATVMVSYIGIEFGPNDVMDMISEDLINTWRSSTGPAPLDFGWIHISAPANQDPPALSFDWRVELDGKGNVIYRMENLFFGQSEYDLGWPWGSVLVNLESGTIVADLGVASVDTPCYADITQDGIVDVSDILEVISGWGYCLDCPADINQDDLINVIDLLEIVSSWGPCPR